MEAQRYPGDYDSLLVGNPANDWTRFYAGAHLWYSLATLADPLSYLPPEKARTLGNAVNTACDAIDGIEDGLLLDPETLSVGPWNTRLPLHWLAGEGFFRHFVFEDPEWDFRSFDYDEDLTLALRKVGPTVDANNPDLSALKARGGKLLVYHGWSDPDISPLGSIRYYENVLETLGGSQGAQALAEVQSFFRLFMVPGLGHCRGGPGPDQFDGLAALTACVWDGKNDPYLAASFRCQTP